MADEFEEAALHTLFLLERRLKRLEHVLGPGSEESEGKLVDSKLQSIPDRVKRLEDGLRDISSKTVLVSDVQQLLARHADLVQATPKDNKYPELTPSERLAMVLTEAPTFPTTASQLKSLTDLPVPSSGAFADLATLRPRIEEVKERQYQQAMEISELRKRSALLSLRWKEVFLVGQGRCWAEFHERCKEAERAVRRTEFKQADDDSSGDES